MKFLKNDQWYYTNKQGVTKKLLVNPATNEPYTKNDEITTDNKYKGKIFRDQNTEKPHRKKQKHYQDIKNNF